MWRWGCVIQAQHTHDLLKAQYVYVVVGVSKGKQSEAEAEVASDPRYPVVVVVIDYGSISGRKSEREASGGVGKP